MDRRYNILLENNLIYFVWSEPVYHRRGIKTYDDNNNNNRYARTLGHRFVQPWIAVAAAHARPAVAQVFVLGARGRGHQSLFPNGPAAAGPGALRPHGRSAALVVRGRRTADMPVRRRRGRGGRRGAGHQMFGAAGRKAERAYGRRPALVHGVH